METPTKCCCFFQSLFNFWIMSSTLFVIRVNAFVILKCFHVDLFGSPFRCINCNVSANGFDNSALSKIFTFDSDLFILFILQRTV